MSINFRKLYKYFFVVFISTVLFNGCTGKYAVGPESNVSEVGFDVDDTLLFSTPAFAKGFESGEIPFSDEFWAVVNRSDRGNSIVKKKCAEILHNHKKLGRKIYVITARKAYGGEDLKVFLSDEFEIPVENIFFEPDGKTNRMKELEIDIFYGDSDSDIKDAIDSGAKGIRILRAKKSSYRKKYNPGIYGEPIINKSEW